MNADWLGLVGKTAAITGAGGGIGRALAVNFASVGVRVVLLDRSEAEAKESAREVERIGGAAHVVACDVSDPDNVAKAAAASLAAFGPADILVNNAGFGWYGYSTDLVVCNRMIPPNVTDGYFAHWKDIQAKYRDYVEESFTPLPILDVPLFDDEVVGKALRPDGDAHRGRVGRQRADPGQGDEVRPVHAAAHQHHWNRIEGRRPRFDHFCHQFYLTCSADDAADDRPALRAPASRMAASTRSGVAGSVRTRAPHA